MAKKSDSGLNAKQLLTQLKKGDACEPLYYLYGDDPYLLQEVVEALKERIQPSFKDFNLHQFSGTDTEGRKLVAAANQLPVMDSHTLVLVREPDQITKESWDEMKEYLKAPSPTTCLVFVDPNRKPSVPGNTSAGKALKPHQVAALRPFENRMPAWVLERAKHHQLKMSMQVAEHLIEQLGVEMAVLENALVRIALFLGGQGEVRHETLEEVIVAQRAYNIFDLSGAVAQGDLQQALRLTRSLIEQGEHPLKQLALLTNAFRDLLRARVELDDGMSPAGLDKYIHPSLRYKREEHVQKFRVQVERFTRKSLIQALGFIHQTDLSIKSSSGLSELLLMEQLMLLLCQSQN
ncbi:MAG: DNA polymerase III subunit delta [Myxococcales bacterium]|nr:DNA polymerase III subunit delta [Myxococcales bacterium]MCB9642111.1 DNA polymerase III subunit delta [Myxococcales bacterium]